MKNLHTSKITQNNLIGKQYLIAKFFVYNDKNENVNLFKKFKIVKIKIYVLPKNSILFISNKLQNLIY